MTDFLADGRTVYNAVQTGTYYVLRVTADGADARDPANRAWPFYRGSEEDVYDTWYPADVSEQGVRSDDVPDVPPEQLGGGYFLLWNDYAALATQDQVWYGMDGSGTWNVVDRMWSNGAKQWDMEANLALSYADFALLRDSWGDFPGMTDCSSPAELPEDVELLCAEPPVSQEVIAPAPMPEVQDTQEEAVGLLGAVLAWLKRLFAALMGIFR